MSKISDIRRDYTKFQFDETSAQKNPFDQFKRWLDNALEGELLEPTAFILSTSKDNRPSSRVLLLKGYDEFGLKFFTNYDSKKGNDLKCNQFASILFFWDVFERQIRIEGKVEKLDFNESNEYFQTRPYTSRIGAWASEQSRVLKSRFSLMKKVALLMLKHPIHVPLPDNWGGYRLIPDYFEFWQGRDSRLHDRIRYRNVNGKWEIDRLNP